MVSPAASLYYFSHDLVASGGRVSRVTRTLITFSTCLLIHASSFGAEPSERPCFPEVCVGDRLSDTHIPWQAAPQRPFSDGAPVELAIARRASSLFPGLPEAGARLVGRYRFNIDGTTFPYFAQVKTLCQFTVLSGRYLGPDGSVTTVSFGPTVATPDGDGLRVLALRRLYPFPQTSNEGQAAAAQWSSRYPGKSDQDVDPASGHLIVTLFDPAAHFFVDDDVPARSRLDAALRAQSICQP